MLLANVGLPLISAGLPFGAAALLPVAGSVSWRQAWWGAVRANL